MDVFIQQSCHATCDDHQERCTLIIFSAGSLFLKGSFYTNPTGVHGDTMNCPLLYCDPCCVDYDTPDQCHWSIVMSWCASCSCPLFCSLPTGCTPGPLHQVKEVTAMSWFPCGSISSHKHQYQVQDRKVEQLKTI